MDGDVRAEPGSNEDNRNEPDRRPLTRTSEQLTIRRQRDPLALTLHVGGVIDTITAPTLAVNLEIALGAGAPMLIVDLTDVDFLAAAGINLLVDVQRLTEGFSTAFRVVAPGPATNRPLRALGLDAYLDVFSSVAAARERVLPE